MKIVFLKIMSIVFGIILVDDVFAQCKDRSSFYEIETDCAKQYSESSYLSDGQDYRALLRGNETAEFYPTFYDENTYRIAACTDIEGGSLLFTVIDLKGHVLFTNKDHENAPYWDLEFKATLECKIIVQLTPETQQLARGSAAKETGTDTEPDSLKKTEDTTPQASVCSVLIIGYKQ